MFTGISFAGQLASLPAVSPGYTRFRISKITLKKGLLRLIYETAIFKTIIPMRHNDTFVLSSDAFSLSIGMCKQVTL